MNDVFKEYKSVKDKLTALEEKKAELEVKIFDVLDADGVTNKITPWGQFAIMGRKTYEYSPAIKEFAADLAKKKKIEELNGTATLKSDSQHIRLIPIKEEK